MPLQPHETLLNKYRIEALIGRGAFAEIYRATHLALNTRRALKILRKDAPGLGSTEFSDFHARFQLEAQLGAKLDHSNIIRVHDFEQDGETLILVMEYAQGGSLSERMARARERGDPIPIEEAIQIAIDVAQGLSAIHALDAVHRDLKPSNILFDIKDRAKVADVGLAQIPGGPSMRSQLSMAAPHPGTAGYMSPEQENSRKYLKPSSDIFALGLILYELLTGRNFHIIKPGTKLSDLRQKIPDSLDSILLSMLSLESDQRPWDGEETAQLLQKELDKLDQMTASWQVGKAAQRQKDMSERKSSWTNFGQKLWVDVSTYLQQRWKLLGIFLLIALASGLLSRQFILQTWPFLPSPTATPKLTFTQTTTPFPTASNTPEWTATLLPSLTPTQTQPPTSTNTLLPTSTFTQTPTVEPTQAPSLTDEISTYTLTIDFSSNSDSELRVVALHLNSQTQHAVYRDNVLTFPFNFIGGTGYSLLVRGYDNISSTISHECTVSFTLYKNTTWTIPNQTNELCSSFP